jgi:hypothetical protein
MSCCLRQVVYSIASAQLHEPVSVVVGVALLYVQANLLELLLYLAHILKRLLSSELPYIIHTIIADGSTVYYLAGVHIEQGALITLHGSIVRV